MAHMHVLIVSNFRCSPLGINCVWDQASQMTDDVNVDDIRTYFAAILDSAG